MAKKIFLVFLCLLLATSTSSSSSSFSDFEALLTLKEGFQSTNQVLITWDSANFTSMCYWARIRCLHNNRVVSVDLSNLNLYGSVSSHAISNLKYLKHLDLSSNNFTGRIEIGNSTTLQSINISTNQFDGALDWNFSSLPSLKVLDAYDNNFKAPLPVTISSSRNIIHLDLAGNFFYGEIPKSYGEMTGLEYLSLAGNDLRGKIPVELGSLTGLRQIYLGYYNSFQGGIPPEFGNMTSLVHMDLGSCELEERIPHELGRLKLLNTLYLHINRLSGQIPKQLGNLTRMVEFDLSGNVFTGEIPTELANLREMRLFNLFLNRLHGRIPEFVAELPELKILGLWMNNFTGKIPGRLGLNSKLQGIDLSSNKLTGTIPMNLCYSQELKVLILLKNFLFGSIPETLGSCRSLVRVRLGQNFLNGSIPDGFLYLPHLNLVELQDNFISGNLSENRNHSSGPWDLIGLNLSNNLLSGNLPFSLSNLSSIQNLLLQENRFTGPIPDSVGKLWQLLKLDLSKNLLTGVIPAELGTCIHLTFLDLSQNNLTGRIPPEISNIRILNYLNVSINHLNQTIPASIGSMKSLTIADFSFNDLTGELPQSGQFIFFNSSSFVGNPQLCGRPILKNICNNSATMEEAVASPTKVPKDFKLIFVLGLLLFFLIFVAVAINRSKSCKRGKNDSGSWKMTAFQKLDFATADVVECVKEGNMIGSGGAGIVYHCQTPRGVEIAVKKLMGIGSGGGDRGLRAEIETLGNIRHRNIVRLLGFCSNKETNLLVYEYMKNGSLGEALHGKRNGGGSVLNWDVRYRIAMDAARGLCYLHHDCSPLILHRDVKSNNILLDSALEAHVADFGLAKFLLHEAGGASQSMSAVKGSFGYIAPEYAYSLCVNEKSDVYSYGVVLLELITGRRPVGTFNDDVDIVHWSKRTTSCRKDNVDLILDPSLDADISRDQTMHLFFIAMLCVQENNIQRPTMREVVQMLSELACRPSESNFAPSN